MHQQEGVIPAPVSSAEIHTPQETTEMLRFIVNNMATKADLAALELRIENIELGMSGMATKEDLRVFATKEDVKKMIGEAKHEVMDYVDKRVTAAENKFILPLRTEDEKVDEFVNVIERAGVLDKKESQRIRCLGPFPKLA